MEPPGTSFRGTMGSRIQLRHLLAYRAIMASGSITAATKLVNLSQPAISRLLARLEDEIGFKLFYRRGRRLVPTVEGISFFRRIEGTLSGIDEIPSIAGDIRLNKQGRLRICGIGPLVFGSFLPSAIARYLDAFPGTKLTVDMRRREDIDEWVASRQTDLGFTLMPVESRAVSSRPIATVATVAALPSGHRLAGRSELTVSDFEGETIILPKQSVRLRQMLDAEFLSHRGGMAVDIETSTALASCQLISQGIGVGLCDPFSISAVRRERVSVARWRPELRLTYCAIWPKDREPSAQALQFLEVIDHASKTFLAEFPEARPAGP